jgi:hypothetical protein
MLEPQRDALIGMQFEMLKQRNQRLFYYFEQLIVR